MGGKQWDYFSVFECSWSMCVPPQWPHVPCCVVWPTDGKTDRDGESLIVDGECLEEIQMPVLMVGLIQHAHMHLRHGHPITKHIRF